MGKTFTPNLNKYAFYNEGTETGSVIIGSESNPGTLSLTANKVLQVRIGIVETGDAGGSPLDDYQLQVQINSGGWNNVTGVSTGAIVYDSADITGTNPTTQRLSSSTGTWQIGEICEDGLLDDFNFAKSVFTEFLYSVQLINADLSNDDSVQFRCLFNGATFTYSVTPAITISKITTYSSDIGSIYYIKNLAIEENLPSISFVKIIDNEANLTSISNIGHTEAGNLESVSYIKQTYSNNLDSISYISRISEANLSSDYNIQIVSLRTENIGSDSTISTTSLNNLTSVSYIKRLGSETSLDSDSFVKILDNEANLVSDSRIILVISNNLESSGFVKRTTSDNLESGSVVLTTSENNLSSNSNVFIGGISNNLGSDSHIATLEYGIESDTWTVIVSSATTYTENIASNSFVLATSEKNLESISFVKTSSSNNLESNSIIKLTTDNNLESNSTILQTGVSNLTSISYVTRQGEENSIVLDSYIKKLANTKNLDSDSWVSVEISNSLVSDSFILTALSNNLTSDSYIKSTLSANIVSNSSILATSSNNLTSDSLIVGDVTVNIISDSSILATTTKNLSSDSFVKKTSEENLVTDSIVLKIIAVNIVSDSEVLTGIERTILVSPICGTSEQSPVTFVWEVPIDTLGSAVHSRIELDTVNTFDSGDLKVYESFRDSGFQYDNGGWISYPVTGVTSTYYGNQARIEIPLDTGTWYWRVRGEVTDV